MLLGPTIILMLSYTHPRGTPGYLVYRRALDITRKLYIENASSVIATSRFGV